MVLPIPIEWAVVKRSLEILGIDLGPHFPSFEPFYPGDFHALQFLDEKIYKFQICFSVKMKFVLSACQIIIHRWWVNEDIFTITDDDEEKTFH